MLRSILLAAAAALLPVSIALAAEPAAPITTAAQRPVALDDINRIESPDGPYLSRDGRQVAYVVDKQIYVVPTNGGPSRARHRSGLDGLDPVLVERRPRALLPVGSFRVEPALEAADRCLWRGIAGDQVRARHRGAQFLRRRVAPDARLHREQARRIRGQGRREERRSPSPGSSRGSNSRRTRATVISPAIERSTCTPTTSLPGS